jgi:hypothetical protein
MSNEPCRIEQGIRRRFQYVPGAQRIFGESSVNMSGSVPEIFAPNLFSLDKSLRGFARFKIFSDAFSVDVVSRDFESVLSVYPFANYLQRVRSSAFSSYGSKRRFHAFIVAYLASNWQQENRSNW